MNGLAAKYKNDMQSLNMQGNELIQNANNEKAMLLSQLENLKQVSTELELQKHDINALYEREKMLWTSKNEFLEHQKNEKAKELEEYQTNFTQAMSKMNQKGQSEKEKSKKDNEAIMMSVEGRYGDQIKDLNDSITKLKSEKDKIKRECEADIAKIKSNMANARNNGDEVTEAKAKIEELKEEIRGLKNEKGKGLSDLRLTVENDKKALSSKTEELNAKLK